MAIGDPLAKTFTYGAVEDLSRATVSDDANLKITPQLFLDKIAMSVLRIQNILGGLDTRFYGSKIQTLAITGTANPYTVDLSSMTNLPLKISRVVHVTVGGVRTSITQMTADAAQNLSGQNSNFAPSLAYVDMGDSIEIWKQSTFTITIATDLIHVYFYRQATSAGMTRTSKVDILDIFVPFLVDDVTNRIMAVRDNRPVDPALDASLAQNIQSTWNNIAQGKQLSVEERP